MPIYVLIVLTLVNGDVYSKVIQMPEHSPKKDCLMAGAQWLTTQKSKDSPQYLCAEKSNVKEMQQPGLDPNAPKSDL